MTTTLITGAAGMLGHKVASALCADFSVVTVTRRPNDLAGVRTVELDLRDIEAVEVMLDEIRPKFIVNCAGIIKQRINQTGLADAMLVNACLPHALGAWSQEHDARLIHVSTDCVFSGDREGAPYRESDPIDATDLYGYSKAAGEVWSLPSTVTLRTSIIGPEISTRKYGLLEWFLEQPSEGTVKGFSNHLWSGVTTVELARLIRHILVGHPQLTGLYQVASEPISKLDLLRTIASCFAHTTRIEPFETETAVSRVLDGTRLREATGYTPPPIQTQLENLCSSANMS